ncbi:hypothetical protein HK100_002430 [Physocladia obscura]|uniref:Uncharacterized protein n=1 Tax=Physocladia obscura TaxID=109957 RepID=A0AAD5XFF7_9FUNG|nr:hypothetical protein HK100_002430 [Physocladia obscura]
MASQNLPLHLLPVSRSLSPSDSQNQLPIANWATGIPGFTTLADTFAQTLSEDDWQKTRVSFAGSTTISPAYPIFCMPTRPKSPRPQPPARRCSPPITPQKPKLPLTPTSSPQKRSRKAGSGRRPAASIAITTPTSSPPHSISLPPDPQSQLQFNFANRRQTALSIKTETLSKCYATLKREKAEEAAGLVTLLKSREQVLGDYRRIVVDASIAAHSAAAVNGVSLGVAREVMREMGLHRMRYEDRRPVELENDNGADGVESNNNKESGDIGIGGDLFSVKREYDDVISAGTSGFGGLSSGIGMTPSLLATATPTSTPAPAADDSLLKLHEVSAPKFIITTTPSKRGRGRPRKDQVYISSVPTSSFSSAPSDYLVPYTVKRPTKKQKTNVDGVAMKHGETSISPQHPNGGNLLLSAAQVVSQQDAADICGAPARFGTNISDNSSNAGSNGSSSSGGSSGERSIGSLADSQPGSFCSNLSSVDDGQESTAGIVSELTEAESLVHSQEVAASQKSVESNGLDLLAFAAWL